MVGSLLAGVALLLLFLASSHIKSAVVGVTAYLLLQINAWLHTHVFIKDPFYKSANDFSECLADLEKGRDLAKGKSTKEYAGPDATHPVNAEGINSFSGG